MNKPFLSLFLALTTNLLFPNSARAEIIDKIVAIVGSEVITLSELNEAKAARGHVGISREEPRLGDELVEREVLEKLIDDLLFNQALKEAKIEVTDDDLARAINNILRQNHISLEALKAELAAKGTPYDVYKKQIEREIRKIKFINQVIGPQVKISDQDLRDYYQRHQDRFRASHKAHLAEIVLPVDGSMTKEQVKEVGDRALDIVKQSKRDPQAFARLAKLHSKGPQSENGGDLGMVNLNDLPEDVATATRRLDIGETSMPIVTQHGVVVIRLIALPELLASDFERLRDEIYGALYDERIKESLNNFLLKQRQKTFIDIR